MKQHPVTNPTSSWTKMGGNSDLYRENYEKIFGKKENKDSNGKKGLQSNGPNNEACRRKRRNIHKD